jgi:hypothetical protein
VFFNELLHCTIRREYLATVMVNEFLSKKENKVRAHIQKLTVKAAKQGHYDTGRVFFLSLCDRNL